SPRAALLYRGLLRNAKRRELAAPAGWGLLVAAPADHRTRASRAALRRHRGAELAALLHRRRRQSFRGLLPAARAVRVGRAAASARLDRRGGLHAELRRPAS